MTTATATPTVTPTATWAKAPNGAWAAKLPTDADLPAPGTPITVVKRDGTEKIVYATAESYATRYGLLVLITNRAPDAPEAPPLDEGVYVGPDGDVVIVTTSKAGRRYAKVWDGTGYRYQPGALRLARAGRTITADEAAEIGYRSGRCVYCARTLSTAESTAVGYGPVCAERYGLPWGAVTAAATLTPATLTEALLSTPEAEESAAEAAAEAEYQRRLRGELEAADWAADDEYRAIEGSRWM